MTERYTDANAPIKDKRSPLTKMLPNALRVGAIGSILLTAACSPTERQFVEAPRGWECSEVDQGNFEPCRQVSIAHGGEVRPVGWKRDTTSLDYKESDYASGFREVKTDWEYEAGEKVGYAIVIGAVIISFLALARLAREDDGHDTSPGWHDPDKDAGKNRPMYVRDHHPLFSATHIQPHPLEGTWFEGPKTLRGNSGVTGHLRSDAIFDRQQIISDNSGRDVGRIEPDALFEDRQVIRDGGGNRVGSIETNWRGERVIKDKDGKETGKFEKKWWGDTEIKWK